ncbi:unnamed protein product [Pieris brassicae]|uniref:Secreted protein n=1 Tax=Pieris brassicae TaxID=7116 RepID=A0A9P0TL03_PIEBR|nr:unnamed protein product [Pieris brassicae]
MSKLTIVLLVIAVIGVVCARPRAFPNDDGSQVNVADGGESVHIVDGGENVNVVDNGNDVHVVEEPNPAGPRSD